MLGANAHESDVELLRNYGLIVRFMNIKDNTLSLLPLTLRAPSEAWVRATGVRGCARVCEGVRSLPNLAVESNRGSHRMAQKANWSSYFESSRCHCLIVEGLVFEKKSEPFGTGGKVYFLKWSKIY